MDLKERFQTAEDDAVAEPFVGVHTSEGIRTGLFPLQASGVSTEPVRVAASTFLASLTPTQLMRTQFAAQDLEWRRWLNVDNGIYSRRGTPLAEMNDEQRDAAMALLTASLSARGVEQSLAIMLTDQALKELNPENAAFLDPDLYYFTVMGSPSATQPWGWQLDGHHLVINYFVLGDQVVMTPTFWGGEPAISRQGSTAGNAVLQSQQDLGLVLMQSLSAEQRSIAILEPEKTHDNMVAGASQDNRELDYAGLAAIDMSAAQRKMLIDVIESYVGALREPHAAVRMEEVFAHLDETWFSWVGATEDNSIFYYRVHSPVILIEFDHQIPIGTRMLNTPGQPTRDHIHTVVRTPNGNDYGRDLLAQHLAAAHSN
ncbi:DUF3500 domain-containing protein [Parasphingopyxis sp. CP4]|uniref:DUF3500 domain-containing protein n=1 Tax=Parasphingopyxis sp. CP4 TaxID=2724527 RepID=UPI001C40B10D|nr:DUF3500 domain-containing protein [Parasphingopyxis sp. CP4]